MEINKTINGDELVIALDGRLDSTSAPYLENEIKNNVTDKSLLTLDLDRLVYLSSAGLRVLLMAQKVMDKQGHLKIINVNETIKEIFDITGFTDILDIQ